MSKQHCEFVPAVDPEVEKRWLILSHTHIRALNDGATGAASLGWALSFAGIISALILLKHSIHAPESGERTHPALWWIVLGFFVAGAIYFLVALYGKKAYLHRCMGQGGGLDVKVLSRHSQFLCDCGMTPKIDGRDNPNLAVIVLSGWYSRWRRPTRFAGMRFHPSAMRFAGTRGREDGCKELLVRAVARYMSMGCKFERVELSLGVIMATRPDLLSLRLALSDGDFSRVVALDKGIADGARQARVTEELAAILAEVEEKIRDTSRFGRSKEAGSIRRFIVEELQRVLGREHPISRLISEKAKKIA